ncbi:hypothetical protein [Thioalkalivibrio denitrificans]|nr:hypothetical protein [Thioalkalivibrio denitrificans]
MNRWILILVPVLVLILMFPATAVSGERLTGEELKAFYTDKTMVWTHFRTGPARHYYGPDGTVTMKRDDEERTGRWWIHRNGTMRCVRWDNRRDDRCHYTQRNADGTHTLVHSRRGDSIAEIHEALPGNQL